MLTLTPMERQVAELVGQGMSNKDIAAHCRVSRMTVAFHLRNTFTKAGAIRPPAARGPDCRGR
jgi:DNA-binding CsgD family transcriptional regulator